MLSYVKDVRGQLEKRSPPREDINSDNPTQKKGKSIDEICMTRHTLNTIPIGFAREGETSSARKRYARTMMHDRKESPSKERDNQTTITFSKKDVE